MFVEFVRKAVEGDADWHCIGFSGDAKIYNRRFIVEGTGSMVWVRYFEANWVKKEATKGWEYAGGEWEENSDDPETWEYHESPEERAWADQQDRKYLNVLAEKKPEVFLSEMTPNPKHNGYCQGLDLGHPHHKDLVHEFRTDVERICKETGQLDHPALLGIPPTVIEKAPEHADRNPQSALGAVKRYLTEGKERIAVLGKEALSIQLTGQIERIRLEHALAKKQALLEKIETKNTALREENAALQIGNEGLQEELLGLEQREEALRERIVRLREAKTEKEASLQEATWIRPGWLRVWGGKRTPDGLQPMYRPVGLKDQGAAPGFIAATGKNRRYVAKLGFPDKRHQASGEVRTRSHERHRTILSILTEKIAADVYGLLGQGFFYVPKHRLARLKILNVFSRRNEATHQTLQNMNQRRDANDQITEGVHLMSRWMEQYRDIATLETCMVERNDEPRPFMACLRAERLPQYASIDEKVVPIVGLMEILAASRLLADTDVLGREGNNAGFVVERDPDGNPVAVRMVKIDAGEAFNFTGENNQFVQGRSANMHARLGMPFASQARRLNDLRDIQFGNEQPLVIKWSRLAKRQQLAFLHAIKRGMAILTKAPLVDFLVTRHGLFNLAIPDQAVLSESLIDGFKTTWRAYRDTQVGGDTYAKALGTLQALPADHVPFDPKTYGAMSYGLEEAKRLTAGPVGNGGAAR